MEAVALSAAAAAAAGRDAAGTTATGRDAAADAAATTVVVPREPPHATGEPGPPPPRHDAVHAAAGVPAGLDRAGVGAVRAAAQSWEAVAAAREVMCLFVDPLRVLRDSEALSDLRGVPSQDGQRELRAERLRMRGPEDPPPPPDRVLHIGLGFEQVVACGEIKPDRL